MLPYFCVVPAPRYQPRRPANARARPRSWARLAPPRLLHLLDLSRQRIALGELFGSLTTLYKCVRTSFARPITRSRPSPLAVSTPTSPSTLAVHLLRVDNSFPASSSDSALNNQSLDTLLDLVDLDSRADIRKFRFLRDARRASSPSALPAASLTSSSLQAVYAVTFSPVTSPQCGCESLGQL